jgi:hypothetical protein
VKTIESDELMEVSYPVWGRHGTVDMVSALVRKKPDARGWHFGTTLRVDWSVAVVWDQRGGSWQRVWQEAEWERSERREAQNSEV